MRKKDLAASGYRIGRLTRHDVDALAVLEGEIFAVPWTREQFVQAFGHASFVVFGAKREGVLAAYLAYAELPGEMEIINLGVAASHRRQGLGRALLARGLARGRKAGIADVFLEVRQSNAAALNLYAQFGFQVAGRRKNYYPDNREDAIVMRLEMTLPGPDVS